MAGAVLILWRIKSRAGIRLKTNESNYIMNQRLEKITKAKGGGVKTILASSFKTWSTPGSGDGKMAIAVYRKSKPAFMIHRHFAQFFVWGNTAEFWDGNENRLVKIKLTRGES